MCIGIPAQVIESGEFSALCRTRNGKERISTVLIGPQPQGAWLLCFLGAAREVICETDARHIDKALDGLSAIMGGAEDIDIDAYFPGLGQAGQHV